MGLSLRINDISDPVEICEDRDEGLICLEKEVDPVKMHACGHIFCKECISDWVKCNEPHMRRCSLCLRDL